VTVAHFLMLMFISSVAMHRFGGIFNKYFAANLLENITVKIGSELTKLPPRV